MIYGWSPGIGDPGPLGWTIVFFYFATAFLAWRAACAARETRDIRFWRFLCLLFLALGLNKQLDLQSLFTAVLRHLARSEGWYPTRYRFQVAFIAAVMVTGTATLLWFVRRHRYSSPAVKAAIAGCSFTFCYVIVRAASFHHMDRLIGRSVGGWKLNWLLELGGILLVAIAAGAAGRSTVRRRPVFDRDSS